MSSQKDILTKFAKEKGFTNILCFVDDGVSGATCDRPDFNRMIVAVDSGEVTTVIVKDMSCFGREYLKVGYYTDIIFVEKDVRFIAISDGVDNLNNDNDFTPIRNLFKNISCSGKSHQKYSQNRKTSLFHSHIVS